MGLDMAGGVVSPTSALRSGCDRPIIDLRLKLRGIGEAWTPGFSHGSLLGCRCRQRLGLTAGRKGYR